MSEEGAVGAGYPFDDDAIRAKARERERIVCGGVTCLEWNQAGNRDVAFACSHGPVSGCGWRVLVHNTDLPFGHLTIWEFDVADDLHRQHAWQRLEERNEDEAPS